MADNGNLAGEHSGAAAYAKAQWLLAGCRIHHAFDNDRLRKLGGFFQSLQGYSFGSQHLRQRLLHQVTALGRSGV